MEVFAIQHDGGQLVLFDSLTNAVGSLESTLQAFYPPEAQLQLKTTIFKDVVEDNDGYAHVGDTVYSVVRKGTTGPRLPEKTSCIQRIRIHDYIRPTL